MLCAAACAVGTALSVAAFSGPAVARTHKPHASMPTVTLMVGGIDKQIYLEYQLAQDLGYYKRFGVNMVLSTELEGGVGAETAMVSGSVDMAGAWYIHAPEFQVAGKAVEDVINLGGAPGEREMCAYGSGIHSTKQWKGHTFGVTDLGSGTDGLTKYMAARAGLNPLTDIHRLAVGAGPTAIAALQQKTAQCVMTTQPTVEQLELKHIGYSMANLASVKAEAKLLGGVYPAAGVLVKTSWANSHKAAVQGVVDALAATLHWIHTHTAAQLAAHMPAKYVTEGVTRAQYVSSLKQDMSQFMPTGIMPAGAPQLAVKIDHIAGVLTASQHPNLAKTYTNAYVIKADQLLGIK